LLRCIGRVRAIEQGNDGYIYVGVENLGILKLLPDAKKNDLLLFFSSIFSLLKLINND